MLKPPCAASRSPSSSREVSSGTCLGRSAALAGENRADGAARFVLLGTVEQRRHQLEEMRALLVDAVELRQEVGVEGLEQGTRGRDTVLQATGDETLGIEEKSG